MDAAPTAESDAAVHPSSLAAVIDNMAAVNAVINRITDGSTTLTAAGGAHIRVNPNAAVRSGGGMHRTATDRPSGNGTVTGLASPPETR